MPAPFPPIVLVAEDDKDDRVILRAAAIVEDLDLQLEFVDNGQELLSYLFNRDGFEDREKFPTPSLILLDLKMPYKNGFDALEEIKEDPELRRIPVVILTTSSASEDRHRCSKLGVAGYVTKTSSLDKLSEILRMVERMVTSPKRGMAPSRASQVDRSMRSSGST